MSATVVKKEGQFSDRESVLKLAKEFGIVTTIRCHSTEKIMPMETQVIRGHIVESIISQLESSETKVSDKAVANLVEWVDVVGYNNITPDKLYRLGSAHYSNTGSIKFVLAA